MAHGYRHTKLKNLEKGAKQSFPNHGLVAYDFTKKPKIKI